MASEVDSLKISVGTHTGMENPPCVENVLPGSEIVARFTETTVSGAVGHRDYSREDLSLSMVRPGERVHGRVGGVGPLGHRFAGRKSARARMEMRPASRNAAIQGERYLKLLPQLRRYMIFGDRLVVLTDSHQVLLCQAEKSGWLNPL